MYIDKAPNIPNTVDSLSSFSYGTMQGYFGKVVTTILARRPEQTLQVLHSKSVVPMLLNHLSASSILELLQKVLN
jgi:hypothetical protein